MPGIVEASACHYRDEELAILRNGGELREDLFETVDQLVVKGTAGQGTNETLAYIIKRKLHHLFMRREDMA